MQCANKYDLFQEPWEVCQELSCPKHRKGFREFSCHCCKLTDSAPRRKEEAKAMSASWFTKIPQCQHIREPKGQMVRKTRPLSRFPFSLLQSPTAVVGPRQLISFHLSKCNWSACNCYLEVKTSDGLLKFMK